MQLNAYAKINWSLDTVGLRDDGYHLLDMVMQSVDLHDTLFIEPAGELRLITDGRVRVPENSANLALRAAQALREHAHAAAGVQITLHKRIPVGAGMGGGSSDAAAVLHGLNALWGLNYDLSTLCAIGLTLGADVPYCLTGGLCRAQGIGEILTPIPLDKVYHLVVIQPCRGLSTRQVFGALQQTPPVRRPQTEGVIAALQTGNLTLLSQTIGNTLQGVSEALRPEIHTAVSALRERGARAAQMTGSGSAVYGVFGSAAAARAAWESLRKKYRVCHLTHTLSSPR